MRLLIESLHYNEPLPPDAGQQEVEFLNVANALSRISTDPLLKEGKINNLVTAIRNTWYFSGQIPEPEWRWEASDRAYATLLLVSERVRQLDPWQHQYLIDSLLGT